MAVAKVWVVTGVHSGCVLRQALVHSLLHDCSHSSHSSHRRSTSGRSHQILLSHGTLQQRCTDVCVCASGTRLSGQTLLATHTQTSRSFVEEQPESTGSTECGFCQGGSSTTRVCCSMCLTRGYSTTQSLHHLRMQRPSSSPASIFSHVGG